MPEETVRKADMVSCDCDPCKRKHGLPHDVKNGTIHSYSSQPRNGWRVRRTLKELADGIDTAPTFGLELETQLPVQPFIRQLPERPPEVRWPSGETVGYATNGWGELIEIVPTPVNQYPPNRWGTWSLAPTDDNGPTDDDTPAGLHGTRPPFEPPTTAEQDRATQVAALADWHARNERFMARQEAKILADGFMTGDEAVSAAAPLGLWHAKHDGSVTGPEFASQPATLAYWRQVKPQIEKMCTSLLHGGLRSHDGGACGLHINIGTDAFNVPSHLERFAQLVADNQSWTMRMSQRSASSIAHWAPFRPLDDGSYRAQWAREVIDYGYSSQDRYCVLNAANRGRVEFRIPRGTLRVDRFYAKLEWAAAMVEYTRDVDNLLRPSDFMKWAERSEQYPALVSFMRERFSAARFEDKP